jgi:type I restriction enzyme, S subunit
MSNNNENKLKPKFRFPEFTSKKWEETTLTQVADYENGKAHEQDIEETGDFIVVNSKFISQDGEVKKYTNTAFCPTTKGDILMVLSDIPNGKAIAKCFLIEEDNRYTVNQRICRITPYNINSNILYYVLNRNPYLLAFDDGVKQTNLRKEDVLNCPLIIPIDPKEQEKIAETLSTLDEIITAESQKLDILKDHKKGLLQNLLPQEGEIVPKFRFKEFEDTGDWGEMTLDDLTTKISDGIHTTPNYENDGEYYFINGNNLIDGKIRIDEKTKKVTKEEYNKHKRNLSESTILLSINGTIGNIAVFNNEKVILGKSACYINIDESKADKTFIIYFIQTDAINKYFDFELTGSTIKNLSLKSIKETIIKIPIKRKEQEKIADTLSSIDDLINAQNQKLEALQRHKKGLLQGLFPNINEVIE